MKTLPTRAPRSSTRLHPCSLDHASWISWFALLISLALAAPARAELPPPTITATVTDLDRYLSDGERARVDAKIRAYAAATGVQLAVLLIRTTDGEPIEDFAQRVFDRWGGGSAERNDGALFVLAVADRRSRLQLGYGLEAYLTDAGSKQILDGLRPALREERWGAATLELVQELWDATSEIKPTGALPPGRRSPMSRPRALILFALIAAALGGLGALAHTRFLTRSPVAAAHGAKPRAAKVPRGSDGAHKRRKHSSNNNSNKNTQFGRNRDPVESTRAACWAQPWWTRIGILLLVGTGLLLGFARFSYQDMTVGHTLLFATAGLWGWFTVATALDAQLTPARRKIFLLLLAVALVPLGLEIFKKSYALDPALLAGIMLGAAPLLIVTVLSAFISPIPEAPPRLLTLFRWKRFVWSGFGPPSNARDDGMGGGGSYWTSGGGSSWGGGGGSSWGGGEARREVAGRAPRGSLADERLVNPSSNRRCPTKKPHDVPRREPISQVSKF